MPVAVLLLVAGAVVTIGTARPASPVPAATAGSSMVQLEPGPNDFRVSDMGADGFNQFDAADPDIAHNSRRDEYLVVWSGDDVTDGEFEIFGRRIDASTGNPLGQDLRISDMGPDSDVDFGAAAPAVVYNPVDDEYLVVWSGDDDAGSLVVDEVEILGQRLDGSGAEIGDNDFRISDMGPDADTDHAATKPAVAHAPANNTFLVVWQGTDAQSEPEVYGQRLDASGVEIGDNDFRISDMGPDGIASFGAGDPAVAHNSTEGGYLVVWWGDDDIAPLLEGELEIFGQRLDASGSEIGDNDFRISDMGPDGNTFFVGRDPAVAHNATVNEYLVVWEGEETDFEPEIFGQRLDASGAEIGDNDFRVSDMGPDGDTLYEAQDPATAYDPVDHGYLVVWWGDDDTTPLVEDEREIFGQALTARGSETGVNDFRISDMGPDGLTLHEASLPAVAHGPEGEYLVVWEGEDDVPPLTLGEREIFGQRLTPTLLEFFAGAGAAPANAALAPSTGGEGFAMTVGGNGR